MKEKTMKNASNDLGLSNRDKTPNPSGWGQRFHHTDPQRRVPCVLGDMLCPRSADDIPPITPEAMASVQAALTLLANLVADRDFNLYLANTDLEKSRAKAREILLIGRGLAGILRVISPEVQDVQDESAESRVARGLHAQPPDHDEVCVACGGPQPNEEILLSNDERAALQHARDQMSPHLPWGNPQGHAMHIHNRAIAVLEKLLKGV